MFITVTAINNFKVVTVKKQYAPASSLLEVINQLVSHFADFTNVPDIQNLLNSYRQVANDLKKDIYLDFEAAYPIFILHQNCSKLNEKIDKRSL
jgi:hypothetical protein